MSFYRGRHNPGTFNYFTALPYQDTTRGRALITNFDRHGISFGYNTMTVHAMGRTTKVQFNLINRSGTAESTEIFPYANAGLPTSVADEYAEYSEQSEEIFKSFLGYVTKIIDPEDRVTEFEYEPYYRTYQGFGFPNTGSNVMLRLKNYRLKRVYEPTADYRIAYKSPSSDTIVGVSGQGWKLNNVVDTVIKGDRGGAVLRRDAYTFTYSDDEQTRLVNSSVTSTDEVTGASSMTTFSFQYWTLPSISLKIPGPRHTEAIGMSKQAGDIITYNATSFAQGSVIPGSGPRSQYLILPVTSGNSVQIGTAPTGPAVGSIQTFSYATDTVLSMGDTGLTNNHGIGITRRIAVTHRALGPPTVMYRDTTDYLSLPRIDTTYMWHGWVFDKFASIANFFYYRDTVNDSRVVGKKWEEVMYREPVAVIYEDSAEVTRTFPAVTGIEQRIVRADSSGQVVSGVSRSIDRFEWRGKPVSDTIIGENGIQRFGASYTYGRGFGGSNLLTSKTNAVGAKQLISYSYSVCSDDPFGGCTAETRKALRMTNANVVDTTTLPPAYYGHLYQKPSSE